MHFTGITSMKNYRKTVRTASSFIRLPFLLPPAAALPKGDVTVFLPPSALSFLPPFPPPLSLSYFLSFLFFFSFFLSTIAWVLTGKGFVLSGNYISKSSPSGLAKECAIVLSQDYVL